MKRACIDTHALIWHVMRAKWLGRAAHRWLRDADAGRAEIVIPAIVPIELALLRDAKRNIISVAQVEALLEGPFVLQALDLADAIEFAAVESIADPFDRMIVAAARVAALPLITDDELITESALVETIWD